MFFDKQEDNAMGATYVVSADIQFLLSNELPKAGLVVPDEGFFLTLRSRFISYMSDLFDNFEFISESEMVEGLARFLDNCSLPIISLDKSYFISEHCLEVSRVVDIDGEDIGLSNRPDTPSLNSQIDLLVKKGIRKAVLVDDVLYSGSLLTDIVQTLSVAGIEIERVIVGIGIQNGIDYVKKTVAEVDCVHVYESVLDEVCERDFYPGVPYSGRLVSGEDGYGMPYVLPFGRPEKWASIPEDRVVEFSSFCLKQTIALFQEIESCSGKVVKCSDLPRKIYGIPCDDSRFVDHIEGILADLRIP